jgi:hypothetical protein
MSAPRVLAAVSTTPVAVVAGGSTYAVSVALPPGSSGQSGLAFKVYDQNQNLLPVSPIQGPNGVYTWTSQTPFAPGQIVGYVALYAGTSNFLMTDQSPVPYPQPNQGEAFPNAGAITLKSGRAMLTGAGATAYTLVAPTAGADDFKQLEIVNQSGQAHTVTTPANAINGADDTATFAATVGATLRLFAYQGVWYAPMATGNGITLSEV